MIRALGSAERRCSFAKPGAFVMVGGCWNVRSELDLGREYPSSLIL
jgi:hypothetical protein